MAKQKTASTPSQADRFKRLADYIQQSRRNRKMSVRKAAQLSSLPDSTIRALENPRRSSLPRSNVVGLYKIYAEILGIPVSKVIVLTGGEEDRKPEFSLKKLPRPKSLVVFSNIGAVAVVLVVFVTVLAYASWQSFGLVSSPRLSVEFPDREFMIVDQSSVEVKGQAEREVTVLINGQPTTVNGQTGNFNQVVFLQEGYNYVNVEVVNSFSTVTNRQYVVIYRP